MENELVAKIMDKFITTDLTIQQIAEELSSTYKIVWTVVMKNFSKEERNERKIKNYSKSKLGINNPMTGRFAEKHHNYRGEVTDGKGYVMVLKPSWYTGRKGSKHVFKHHVVICEHLGLTEIPAGFCVHHVDGNSLNNDVDNLVLLSLSAHSKLHSDLKRATTISKESRE